MAGVYPGIEEQRPKLSEYLVSKPKKSKQEGTQGQVVAQCRMGDQLEATLGDALQTFLNLPGVHVNMQRPGFGGFGQGL